MMTPTFIDLFAGCGGLSLGLLSSGWQGILAIEMAQDAFATLERNLIGQNTERPAGQPVYSRWPNDIPKQAWELDAFLGEHIIHLQQLQGQVALLAGGPPCQGFSMAGRRNGSDPRNRLFVDYLSVVAILSPAIVLIENVKGMDVPFEGSDGRGTFAQKLKKRLSPEYHVEQGILLSEDFGVPQVRPRLITVGFRREAFEPDDLGFFNRLSRYRKDFLKAKGLATQRKQTVADALSDIAACDAGQSHQSCTDPDSPVGFREIRYDKMGTLSRYQRLMRSGIDNGYQPNSLRLVNHRPDTIKRFRVMHSLCNVGALRRGVQLSETERAAIAKRGATVSKKHVMVVLDGAQPAHTITTIPDDLLHYCRPRVHTIREYARLQSFPDWFAFQGKFTTGGDRRKDECPRYTQVGNAVPPLLAEAIGRVLLEILTRG
jgi:DNA (cytosine-5)-methyltransferase 1